MLNPNFDSWGGAFPGFLILNTKKIAGLSTLAPKQLCCTLVAATDGLPTGGSSPESPLSTVPGN